MSWQELPPLVTDVATQLPPLPHVQLVAARVGDHSADLHDAERPAVARAVARRAHEFSTGRWLARRAIRALGLTPGAIPRADDRRPLWPDGVVGSITHAGELAVAGATHSAALAGLGLDLEDPLRITEHLFAKLFTDAERQRLESADPRLPGLMFSAKEAGYKAVNPAVGRFIGFHEAEVLVDWPARRFRLRYVGEHAPNRLMEEGEGHFCFFERYVLTLFMIPAQR